MIITRTPFRISFFGGGTDYPAWYRDNGGSVLSASIDKYCYISCRHLPQFFEYKSRIVWSKIESVKQHEEIQHPAVRAILNFLQVDHGIEIHHDADLPARSGLGSSSSFTVGLLHALYGLGGKMMSKHELAKTAIHVEQDVIQENVGSQDQVVAAFGGFNKIDFLQENDFHVTPVAIKKDILENLRAHCLLVFSGFSRTASEIAAEQIKTIPQKQNELRSMHGMVDEAISILQRQTTLDDFGKLLHESWMLKRSLSKKISTSQIDAIYDTALQAGALGGKVLGAGGGGFLLLFVLPERRHIVCERLKGLLEVPFHFEYMGSQVIFYDPTKIHGHAS